MRLAVVLAGFAIVLLAGCARAPAPAALVSYRDDRLGFAILRPQGWQRAAGTPESEVRFVPPGGAPEGAEFITVVTVPTPGGPSELEIRRQVFSLLAIHGVSGFQQDPRTTADVLWYKFEVTGTAAGTEWASVGVAAAGRARMQIAVCATPLPRWRQGQKACDQVVRSFTPGDLAAP